MLYRRTIWMISAMTLSLATAALCKIIGNMADADIVSEYHLNGLLRANSQFYIRHVTDTQTIYLLEGDNQMLIQILREHKITPNSQRPF